MDYLENEICPSIEKAHHDCINDIFFFEPRELSWENIILNMEYPIHISPDQLWSYKFFYFISYKESYNYTRDICNIFIKVLEELSYKIAISECSIYINKRYQNIYDFSLNKKIFNYII